MSLPEPSQIVVGPATPQLPTRRFRQLRWAIGFVAVALLGLGLWQYLQPDELANLRSELDRTDPGWRFDDIWANYIRTQPIPANNSYDEIPRALAALPAVYLDWTKHPDSIAQQEFVRWAHEGQLDRATIRESLSHLEDARAALTILHGLRHRTDLGVPPTTPSFDAIGTLMPHYEKVRDATNLLQLEGVLAALDGDTKKAILSAIGCVQVGRTLGEEPFGITQSLRARSAVAACDIVELALAHGEVPEVLLAELQTLLAKESESRILLTARAARADIDLFYDNFHTGRDSVSGLCARYGLAVPVGLPIHARIASFQAYGDHFAFLRQTNEWVRIAKAPEHERLALARRIPPFSPRSNIIAKLLRGLGADWSLMPMLELDLRNCARIRSTIAAVSCERHRLRTGSWPTTLADAMPSDPYTGQPLILRRTATGLIVYSVGVDGLDDGGTLSRVTKPPDGTDVGFELFDTMQRVTK